MREQPVALALDAELPLLPVHGGDVLHGAVLRRRSARPSAAHAGTPSPAAARAAVPAPARSATRKRAAEAASITSSHPEVGGEAAAYFNPANTEEMTTVISRLLTNQDEYQKRRELGLQQAAKFSWPRAAQETIAIYDEILENKNF
jgi:glycosyltransferase involved in cell wall biosynthesis